MTITQSTDPHDTAAAREQRATECENGQWIPPEDFLKADDPELVKVPIPGGYVYVGTITAEERDDWEQWVQQHRQNDAKSHLRHFRSSFVALCMRRPDGTRCYPRYDLVAPEISKKMARVVDIVYKAAGQLNHIEPADEEEAVKNCKQTEDEGSSMRD